MEVLSQARMKMEMGPKIDSQETTDYDVGQHRLFWRKLIRNKMFLVGGTIILIYILSTLVVPLCTKSVPTKMNVFSQFSSPSWKYLMGTDQYGRDIFIRVIYGIRTSFKVGIFAVLIGWVVGMTIGWLSGYFGGVVDDILMRLMDALLAFPHLILAISLVTVIGPGLKTVCIAIGVINVAQFARLMRSSVLVEKKKEYVEAVKAIGQSDVKILLKHIGPNCLSPVLVLATILFAHAITYEAILSFLGVGVQPPTPSLGAMINESRQYLASSLYLPLFPGIIICIAVLGFNLIGDGLRDILDPKIYHK